MLDCLSATFFENLCECLCRYIYGCLFHLLLDEYIIPCSFFLFMIVLFSFADSFARCVLLGVM